MEYIVVACSDSRVVAYIKKVVKRNFQTNLHLRVMDTEEDILKCLNFEFPELVIINFSDTGFSPEHLRDHILRDSWLHHFGIMGLYDHNRDKEKEILQKHKGLNLLAIIDIALIEDLLEKTLNIIKKNKQLIFQGWFTNKLVNRLTGSFIINNSDYLLYPVFSGLLAMNLMNMGRISSEDRHNIKIALNELLLNAIEHGNCGIRYTEKSRWIASGKSMHELILHRCRDAKVAAKTIQLDWDISEKECRIDIRDEGEGFPVKTFQEKLKKDVQDRPHGRGVLMASAVADKLIYNKKGNQVSMVLDLARPVENRPPAGFAEEEVITVKAGETLMRVGEFSDSIYYITSGTYTVYHQGKAVGHITSANLLMGELAFLLNNVRSATVVADTPGKVIKISRKHFVEAIKDYPQYGIFLAKLVAEKLIRTNENLASNSMVSNHLL